MKGWIYVITNKAMPGLVKVGYSSKDPQLRADELSHTGSPHPYLVDYEILVEDPFQFEQRIHRQLSSKREGKEWFRCSSEEAIVVIKKVAGGASITEAYKQADREKADQLRAQQERERQREREIREKEREIEQRLQSEERSIFQRYEQLLASKFPRRPFWNYWLAGAVVVFIGVMIFFPKTSDLGAVLLIGIGGAIIGVFIQGYFEERKKGSSAYQSLVKQRDTETAAVRSYTVSCPQCSQSVRFDRAKRLSTPNGTWSCPKCKTKLMETSPPMQ